MNCIKEIHLNEYGIEPAVIIEVPQVMTILGAFSDCIDGYALMGTNANGMTIGISKREDNSVKALNVSKQDKKKFQITSIKYRKEDRWANCIKAVLQELVSLGIQLTGLNITIKGESSICDNSTFASSMFVGILTGLNSLFNLNLDSEAIKRIAFLANRFSSIYQARLRDLITLLYIKPDSLAFFDLASYDYEFIEYPKKENISSILISTSIPFSVLTPELDEFRDEMCTFAKELKGRIPKGIKLRDLSEKDIRQGLHIPQEQKRRQLMFLIEESLCALKSVEALKTGDYISLGRMLNAQERSFETKAELTSPEIDWIVKRSNEIQKIYGICQIYIGAAGTLLALIDTSVNFPYTCHLEEYERIFGFHANIRPYIPYGGVRCIRADEYSTCQ